MLHHGKGCIRPVSLQRRCVIGPMSLNFHAALLCILQFSFAALFRNYVITLENNSCLNVLTRVCVRVFIGVSMRAYCGRLCCTV